MSEQELLQAMWDAFQRHELTGHPDSPMVAVLDVLRAYGYRRCAEGQGTTQWCERAEKAEAEVERLRERNDEWERKASAWMASPEAGQWLDGYRELAQRLNAAEAEVERLYACRDELREVTAEIDDPAVNISVTLKDAVCALVAERDALRAERVSLYQEQERLRDKLARARLSAAIDAARGEQA